MTGFNSKRQAAQAKVDDDDDTQVYADTLLIVYQRGFADGKKAAQRKWAGLTDDEITEIYEMGLGVRASIETALDKIEERNT